MQHFRMKVGRWLMSAAVLLGVAVAGPVATAPAAAAATGCNGTLIDQINHDYNGSLVAITYLYWDGTYNCVKSVKAGSYYGVSSRMGLTLMTPDDMTGDTGYFKYYAGPIKLYGKGKCIAFELDMWKPNGPNFLQDRIPFDGWFHCG
ncbi:hypothetical protein ACL02U_24600 [Streptomyces sp. MS06]|uniref:hypothetical protein n=1 Tax=Streptomyces sp. MS06 TaxID=3385974 RepID=UPI0039A3E5CE